MNAKLSLPLFLVLGAAPAAAQVAFGPATSHPVGPQPDGVAFGDFDGDGDNDMAATADNPDRVSIRLNNGHGTFAAPVSVLTGGGTGPHAIVAGDLDGDLDVDLAVTLKNTSQVLVLKNNGGGGFAQAGTTAVGSEPRAMALANLDGDGDLDLVTSNRDGNSLTVLTNAGNATFAVATLAAGNEPREVTTGEFTGDASVDIAVAVHDDAMVRVFAGGPSGFSQFADLPLGGGRKPQGIEAGRVDAGLTRDLVTSSDNNGIHYVSVFRNNGNGTFAAPVHTIIAGQDNSSLTLGDFDLDGDMDAATANTDTNDVSVLENVNGSLMNEVRYAVGTTPNFVTAADLDGNASPDLATSNETSGDVSVLLSQATCGVVRSFCTAKAGLACGTPSIASTGTPSASATSGFSITAAPARADRTGVLLYNTGSQAGAPFQGGTLCVQATGIRRGGPANSGGSATCDGTFAIDLNTFAAGLWPQPSNTPAPFLQDIGQRVSVQWWGRDTVATGSFLSNALEYTVCP
jgi:hypothetical protein